MRIVDWSSDACSSDLQPREKDEPHLLKIARQAVDEQAFPRVARAHMRRERLRPVEPERLAEMGEGVRHRDLVVAAPFGEVDDADRAVELEQEHGRAAGWARGRQYE